MANAEFVLLSGSDNYIGPGCWVNAFNDGAIHTPGFYYEVWAVGSIGAPFIIRGRSAPMDGSTVTLPVQIGWDGLSGQLFTQEQSHVLNGTNLSVNCQLFSAVGVPQATETTQVLPYDDFAAYDLFFRIANQAAPAILSAVQQNYANAP